MSDDENAPTDHKGRPTMTTRQARYVVRKADHVGGAPIPIDEPVLVIRAQDVMALTMMDEYIERYEASGHAHQAVLDELRLHREALIDWQAEHRPKWADR